ncbi:hypothetical protein PspLS_04044 [Pyricularia sp. CBS 133598]|nr:hypothetical protein PspLS_04044 [Pyricularia sp. CBS 133598]
MQFSTVSVAIFAILPALVAGKPAGEPKPLLPVEENLCPEVQRLKCPKSTDELHRCLQVDGASLCAIDCGSQTTCRTQCQIQLNDITANGFCTTGYASLLDFPPH